MQVEVGPVTIQLRQGDIARQSDVDAVVNAANAELRIGGGVAGALHRAAGPELEEATREHAPIAPGEAVITEAFALPNRWVVHCLGPVYGHDEPADELLSRCYERALAIADEKGASSIAFPAISTGAFGYPAADAAEIALSTVLKAASTLDSIRLVRFVLYSDDDLATHRDALRSQKKTTSSSASGSASGGDDPSPAELFETFFGASIFRPWTRILLERVQPRAGDRVLDLACATGIVARNVAGRVGEDGRVVGVDINPQMLAVARERGSSEGADIEWHEAGAEDLPLPSDSFDLVLCQQGLQFFEKPAQALREAVRVLGEGGRMGLTVWQPLARHPVYEVLLAAEARYLNADLADVATPFMFGDAKDLSDALDGAGFERLEIEERTLEVEFPDPEKFVALTVLAAAAVVPEFALDDPDERAGLIRFISRECEEALERHRDGNRLRFPMPNYLAVAYA